MSPWSLAPRSLQPGQREKSFQPEQDSGKVFRGHRCGDCREQGWGPFPLRGPGVTCVAISWACVPRNQVTCLSVSTDGSVLLSGSHDETVRLWDIQSRQCIRTVTLKGGTGSRPRAWGGGGTERLEGSTWLRLRPSRWAGRWEAGLARGGGGGAAGQVAGRGSSGSRAHLTSRPAPQAP